MTPGIYHGISKSGRPAHCTVGDCTKPVNARGMCHAHYSKWLRLGDPNAGGTKAPNGLGSICKKRGYERITVNGKQVLTHVFKAKQALGKSLPTGAQVHHIDGNRSNNAGSNLVVCQDDGYHKLIHQRTRALEESGDANNLLCDRCCRYDSPQNLTITKTRAYHGECNAKYAKQWRKSGGKK